MRHELTSTVTLSRDGQLLGAVADEQQALAVALDDADALTTDAEYEIRKTVKFIVKRRIVGPDAPALGPVLTISSTALTVTLDRPATGPTTISRYELERLVGSTWTQIATGLSIFGAANQYPDTGLIASTAYSYRARAVDTTERVSEWSYSSGTTSAGVTNTAPVWQSGTLALSVQAGSSVALSPYCSDPEGDQITYELLDTNPNDATISVSQSGVLQTTAATTVRANSVIVRASDGALTANKTIALTVTAASTGQTFTIPQGTATYNASAVQPGDVIVIEGDVNGNRGPLKITNANGSASSRITIRNPTTKRVNVGATATGGYIFELNSSGYVTIDGSAYSGATYGLNFTRPAASSSVTSFVKFTGQCSNITMRYFEVSGKQTTFVSAVTPIGVSAQDKSLLLATQQWRENLTFENFYIHDVAGEGLYIGNNFSDGCIPMRNIIVSNGTVTNTGRDGCQVKGWWEGTNSISGLTISNCGRNSNDQAGQRFGISLLSGTGDVYNNVITDIGESGIQVYVQNGPNAATSYTGYGTYATFAADVYNNVVARTGLVDTGTVNTGNGITAGTDAAARTDPVVSIYNNTVVNAEGAGVNIGSDISSSSVVQNNILLGNGSATSNGSGATINNNLTTGAQSSVFVAPELDNYHLSGEQAVTAGLTSASDIEGTSRAGTASKGAYEYV